MKKILLASLLLVSVISTSVFAEEKAEKRGRGPGKPIFTNGCLVVESDAKGPMADAVKNADADSDGCITEDELKTYMKDHKPEGRPEGRPEGKEGKGPRGKGPKGEKKSKEVKE